MVNTFCHNSISSDGIVTAKWIMKWNETNKKKMNNYILFVDSKSVGGIWKHFYHSNTAIDELNIDLKSIKILLVLEKGPNDHKNIYRFFGEDFFFGKQKPKRFWDITPGTCSSETVSCICFDKFSKVNNLFDAMIQRPSKTYAIILLKCEMFT